MEDTPPLEPLALADQPETDCEVVTVSLETEVLDEQTSLIWQWENNSSRRNQEDA